MDLQSFWIKCVCLVCGFFVLTCVVSAGSMAVFHSKNLNQIRLQEMKQQSQNTRGQFEDEIRYLVLDLIQLQKGEDRSKNFIVHGMLNKHSREVVQIYPKKLSQELKDKFRELSYVESSQHFPITFYSMDIGKSKSRQVVLLVDLSQIKNPNLPMSVVNSGILFGVVSYKKMNQLSKSIVGGGFSEAFIYDAHKGWWPLHSKFNQSGQSVPRRYVFYKMVQKFKQGWVQESDTEKILTTGIKLTFSDNYLVLNRKKAVWKDYFTSSLKEVIPYISGLSLLLFILLVFFVKPIVRAFEYLSLILRSYAISRKFPIPESNKNPYVMQTFPWIKKIYWDLRSRQIVDALDQDEQIELFSQLIKKLAREIEDKYKGMEVQLRFIEDVPISNQIGWLKQVFLEILKNAVECTNSRGQIDICTLRKDHLFYCIVRNYGKRISQTDIDRMRQDYDLSRKDGMELVVSVVSQMGGQIHYSDKDPGLEVEVGLPLQKARVIRQQGFRYER